jgi:uncharacterized protein YndB with AHSA1/START domain
MTTTNSTGALKVTASGDREIIFTRAFDAPRRLVFDVPWYPGECVITTGLVEQGGRTTFTATLRYESREARDVVLGAPMERGVAECYDKLADPLASTR